MELWTLWYYLRLYFYLAVVRLRVFFKLACPNCRMSTLGDWDPQLKRRVCNNCENFQWKLDL